MKNLAKLLFAFVLVAGLSSCGSNENGTSGPISVKPSTATFYVEIPKPVTFLITTDAKDWTVETEDSWITIEESKATKSFTVTATKNTESSSREATIKVYTDAANTQTITLTQGKYVNNPLTKEGIADLFFTGSGSPRFLQNPGPESWSTQIRLGEVETSSGPYPMMIAWGYGGKEEMGFYFDIVNGAPKLFDDLPEYVDEESGAKYYAGQFIIGVGENTGDWYAISKYFENYLTVYDGVWSGSDEIMDFSAPLTFDDINEPVLIMMPIVLFDEAGDLKGGYTEGYVYMMFTQDGSRVGTPNYVASNFTDPLLKYEPINANRYDSNSLTKREFQKAFAKGMPANFRTR